MYFQFQMFLPNLTSNKMYEVKIRGATRSLKIPSKIYPGSYSESQKIFVANDCNRLSSPLDASEIFNREIELSAGMIAALVCASFALILVILAFILWRKYFQVICSVKTDSSKTLNQVQNSEIFITSEDDSNWIELLLTGCLLLPWWWSPNYSTIESTNLGR